MDSLGVTIALLIAAALMLQCGSCFFSKKRPLSIGFLDLILSSIVIFMTISLRSGQMVLGAEFGTIMIQGPATTWLMRITLILIPVLPGLCWYGIRRLNDEGPRLWLFLLPALLVGAWAATRLQPVNPSDPEILRVYLYDVWWPPMIAWLTVCFACTILALARAEEAAVCLAFSAALLAPTAEFARYIGDLPDPQSSLMWSAIERAALVISVGALAFLFTEGYGKWRRWALCLLLGAAAGAFAFVRVSDLVRTTVGVIPLLPLVVAVIVSIADELTNQGPAARAGRTRLPYAFKAFPIGRLSGIAHSLALPVIAFCAIDLFSVGYLNRSFEAVVLFLFWILFAERLAQGALDSLPELFKNGVLQLTIVKKTWVPISNLFTVIRKLATTTGRFFTEGSPWVVTAKATLVPVVGLIVALMALTALDELTSHRPIVIGSFQWTGSKDVKIDVPHEISFGLVNALGRLRADLQPDLVIPGLPGEQPPGVRVPRASASSDSLESAVARSDDLQISGVRVPVTFFLRPVQNAVRQMLGTKVIDGSIQTDANTNYIVLANSDDGNTWMEANASGQQQLTDCQSSEPVNPDPTVNLVERLAFDIASSDPSFIAAGLTKDWTAFRYFHLGLEHWNTYTAKQERTELVNAISCFEKAVRQDRRFAFAYYRLGLAMQQYGQPGAALEAFRNSTDANSDFIPGALMQAETISNFTDYYPSKPAIADSLPSFGSSKEALNIWGRIVTRPEYLTSLRQRRVAYLGLCEYERDKLRDAGEDLYLPYYYCSRAHALFLLLSPAQRQEDGEKRLEGEILNSIGITLDSHRRQFQELPATQFPNSWSCWDGAIDEADLAADGRISKLKNFGSRTSGTAVRYYRQSLQLDPSNVWFRCNLATSEAYLNPRQMNSLRNLADDPIMRSQLGDSLVDKAHGVLDAVQPRADEVAAGYYHRALDEYQAAIRKNPAFVHALNTYAYTVWEWQVGWLRGRIAVPPDSEMISQAEIRARQGLQIARCLRPDASKKMSETEMMLRDTLGEILLAQGRAAEAIENIEPIVNNKPEWDGLNETRWDLAQAEMCAANRVSMDADRRGLMDKAMHLFADIEADEERREVRPLSTALGAFSPLGATACLGYPDRVQITDPTFTLTGQSYDPGPSCNWSSATAKVFDGSKTTSSYVLHVWGGGIDERISIGGESNQSALLETPAKTRHMYYFAQLLQEAKDKTWSAASPIVQVDTDGSGVENSCPKNRVTLVFRSKAMQLADKTPVNYGLPVSADRTHHEADRLAARAQ